jgi:hypothetical protein
VAWGSATLQIYNTFKRVSLLNHLANVRLFTGIAFAGHTGATVAADLIKSNPATMYDIFFMTSAQGLEAEQFALVPPFEPLQRQDHGP